MSTKPEFAQYVCDQIQGLGTVTFKKMFGEYGLYCNGKICGLICDDMLFVRVCPTGKNPQKIFLDESVRKLLDETKSPFPGAKNYGCIPGDVLEDVEQVSYIAKAIVKMLNQKT